MNESPIRHTTLRVTASAAAALLLASCMNFHTIEEGVYYRSAQLDADELSDVITEHGIRTIINLRGHNEGKPWYDAEAAVARDRGVDLVDIGMSARRFPRRDDLMLLLDTFRNAERPLLVHCQGGADRTGLATAIWFLEYMGADKKRALGQLTLQYLHFSNFQPSQRRFVELYQGEEWAREAYFPCRDAYEYFDASENCP